MAANANPIFSRIGVISGSVVGNTATSGQLTASSGAGVIGTTLFNCFTADPTSGSFVQRLRLSPGATTAATATNATVFRVFVSSQSTNGTFTTQANTWLFQEIAAPTFTADQTTTGAPYIEIPLNFALPPNFAILVGSHQVLAANTTWTATVFGGSY